MKAFQLKITIKNSKPPIWRRVIVPAGITFSQLSMILNEVMGWSGYHMFEIEFYHRELRVIEEADEIETSYGPYDYIEASTTYIREYLERNDWFTYTYDLGDDWQHRVTVEKILTDYEYDYPQVLKYKGNCPVEDCGGIEGYYECLDVISNPNHPEHEERLQWMESQGYPSEYNMEDVNKTLKTSYYYIWGKGEKRTQRELYEEKFCGNNGLQATKKDKNKNVEINQSGKHQLETLMNQFAQNIKAIDYWNKRMQSTSLKDIFEDYEKADLMEIAKAKNVKGISSCNKEKLIDKLVEHMLKPEEMERYFACYNDIELKEFELASHQDYHSETEECGVLYDIYQSSYIGMQTNGAITVPKDVFIMYEKIRNREFEAKRQKVSFVYDCLKVTGLLYGIAPVNVMMQMISQHPDIQVTKEELQTIILELPTEYNNYVMKGDKVYHNQLYFDDRGLVQAQGNKEYYIPTLQEIRDLSTEGYLPNEKYLMQLKTYLRRCSDLLDGEVEMIACMIQISITQSCTMEEIYEILEDFNVYMENEKHVKGLMKCLDNLWNNTRMLLNRGFTPNELVERERKTELLAPRKSNIIDIAQARKGKVYPNEPCPCGPGKKYKNCCKNK